MGAGSCCFIAWGVVAGVPAEGGGAGGEGGKFLLKRRRPKGPRPPMLSSPIPAARCPYLLDLLAQVPDTRKRRGRRHALAGLLAVGIAAGIAGARAFAPIGPGGAHGRPEGPAPPGGGRGPAGEAPLPS